MEKESNQAEGDLPIKKANEIDKNELEVKKQKEMDPNELEVKKQKEMDPNELGIKKEYLLSIRERVLCTELLSEKDRVLIDGSEKSNENVADSIQKGDLKSMSVKLKGQNKNRPPPMRFDISERICPSLVDVAVDEEPSACPYNPNCRYRHDVIEYMKERKPDVLPGGCPNYQNNGRCSRGISCLFGEEHVTPEGRNKKNPNPISPGSEYYNFLSKDLQKSLRKKTYNFKKAENIVKKNNKNQCKDEVSKNVKGTVDEAETELVHEEPAAKKTKVEIGPITDEDIISLKPDEKKKIDWKGKLYLAPLTTVGNLPFRRLCKKLGADITCGEMAMAESLVGGGHQEWALVRKHKSEDLFGVQICGANPYILGKCTQLLEENTEVDFIDLNLGCPIDMVYQKGAGSGLMRRRGPLESSIKTMSQLLKIPFTVKMRMGVYTDHPFAHQLVEKCRDWGVSMVTVHGRSREQRYTRLADWDYIRSCVKAADPMPIFGNGDLMSYEDYERVVEQSGVAGVMIARGALIKPWIFTEIKERRHWDISSSERFQYMKDFCNYGLEHWGSDSQGVERTRRFLLEWQSFAHRYVPVGLLERPPQKMNLRPPPFRGRDDLETLLGSPNAGDWVRICEMFLGPAPDGFQFLPKHKANSWK
ncbi:tRNA-dihydrouridine(47) synthase [NAD(P)(+)]-like isoform X1 [Daphnia magna]|uniref:tRNA-dihydrouridine(47) synthase [NAD(P)(+)]-like isoform X1 n=1 Tax=Daphnia magna TaxID=35525 RepID=UPI001E1BB0B6|nr:tRNA-dihydrouridine(47) synthase [NAD(P)(+)]-like isoform X1 [Daphnia magna]